MVDKDDTTTGAIELGDMSKLRVLMRLRSRGQLQYATDLANEMEGADAKAVAQVLLTQALPEANGAGAYIALEGPSSNGRATRANGAHPSARVLKLAQKLEKTWAEHNRR